MNGKHTMCKSEKMSQLLSEELLRGVYGKSGDRFISVRELAKIKNMFVKDYMIDTIDRMKSLNSVEELMDYLCISWECMSDDWKDIANYLSPENPEKTEKNLLENEWINVIGDYYIVVYPI